MQVDGFKLQVSEQPGPNSQLATPPSMPKSSEELAHLEWLGFVQPEELVVSIPALPAAQAHVNRNVLPLHERFLSVLPRDEADEPVAEVRDFARFTQTVLGWRANDLERLAPGDARYASAEAVLPSYYETLRPTYVVRDPDVSGDNAVPWMMLVKVLPSGEVDDETATDDANEAD